MFILPILTLALFCKKGLRPQRSQRTQRRQKTGDRRRETESRRGNTGLAGMGVLALALFSISRILYLLDVYYTTKRVVCQVKCFPAKAQRREGHKSTRAQE